MDWLQSKISLKEREDFRQSLYLIAQDSFIKVNVLHNFCPKFLLPLFKSSRYAFLSLWTLLFCGSLGQRLRRPSSPSLWGIGGVRDRGPRGFTAVPGILDFRGSLFLGYFTGDHFLLCQKKAIFGFDRREDVRRQYITEFIIVL